MSLARRRAPALALATAALSLLPCGHAAAQRDAPPRRPPPSPALSAAAARFVRAAVSGADLVARVVVRRVDTPHPGVPGPCIEVEVLERAYGGLTPRRLYLYEVVPELRARLTVGAVVHLVAATYYLLPEARVPLLLFDDTPAERARLAALSVPGWRRAPIVVIARAAPAAAAAAGALRPGPGAAYAFVVERTLRGSIANRALQFIPSAGELAGPPSAGTGRWLLALDQRGPNDPLVIVDYTRVDDAALPLIERTLADPNVRPRRETRARAAEALEQLHRGWQLRTSHRVAVVTETTTIPFVATNVPQCQRTLTLDHWLRGSEPASGVLERKFLTGSACDFYPTPVERIVAFNAQQQATAVVGRDPLPATPWRAPARALDWLTAPRPWYAGGTDDVTPGEPELLRVPVGPEELPTERQAGLGWVRLEVRAASAPRGGAAPAAGAVEFVMFDGPPETGIGHTTAAWRGSWAATTFTGGGAQMPAFAVGERYWVAGLSDGFPDYRVERDRDAPVLLLPDTMVPDAARTRMMALRATALYYAMWE